MSANNKKILAIIPARGGSKGVPGKNIKSLASKPLIVYSIEAARKCRYIDRLVVSTDDDDIARVVKDYKTEVIKRPKKLAQDNSPTAPSLSHAVNYLKETEKYNVDFVVLLQPTSPLRTFTHIDEMIEKYISDNYDSMLSVSLVTEPRFILQKDDTIKPANKKRVPRQERPSVIFENGAIYIIDINLVMKNKITGDKIGYYAMDKESSIDIDDPIDFIIAEQILLNK